jgi:hypothetical protein
MIHLSILSTSYGQKKGEELKCQFNSRPLKVKNSSELHLCKWWAIYIWKALDEGYNFASSFTWIKGLHMMLWAFKVSRVPILKILRLPTWESREKWHLDVAPMVDDKKYYKKEGGGFFQV